MDTLFRFVNPFSYFFSVITSNKSTGQHVSENLASLPLYHCVLLCFQTGSSHVTQCSHICAIVTQINTRTEDPRGTKRPFRSICLVLVTRPCSWCRNGFAFVMFYFFVLSTSAPVLCVTFKRCPIIVTLFCA